MTIPIGNCPSSAMNTEASISNRQLLLFSLLLTTLALALYTPYLQYPQLFNEETRRVLIAETMMETGNYWVPMLEDRVYTAKPPLYNWLIVATSLPQGFIDGFSARINSVICLGLLALTMVWGLRRHLSPAGLAFVGFALVLAPELGRKAQLAEIESAFTLLVTLSIWGWFWLDQRGARNLRLWLPPAILLGLAYLTKREPALVFYYFAIGGYLLCNRRLKELFLWPHLLSAGITLAIAGLWLGAIINEVGLDAFISNTLSEVVKRGVDRSVWDYVSHIALYPLELMIATFPFSLLLLPLVSADIRRRVRERHPQIYQFALIAILVNLPVYLFRGQVSVRYFMPMMPTMLVLAALVFELLASESSELARRWLQPMVRLLGLLSLVLAISVNLLLFPEQLGITAKPADLLPTSVSYLISLALLITTLILLKPAWRSTRRYALVMMVLLMIGIRALHFDVLLPHKTANLKAEEDYPGLVSDIYRLTPQQQLPVQTYGEVPHAFWYFMNYGDVVSPAKTGHTVPRGYFVAFRPAVDELTDQGVRVEELSSIQLDIGELLFARVLARLQTSN